MLKIQNLLAQTNRRIFRSNIIENKKHNKTDIQHSKTNDLLTITIKYTIM